MDAYSGYNQIRMHEPDQIKTTFVTDCGLYCYKVMPFGLKNAGATYQRLVNRIFADLIGKTMEVYVDDMLVKSLLASFLFYAPTRRQPKGDVLNPPPVQNEAQPQQMCVRGRVREVPRLHSYPSRYRSKPRENQGTP